MTAREKPLKLNKLLEKKSSSAMEQLNVEIYKKFYDSSLGFFLSNTVDE